ncbi:MAG: tRNA (N(6)-L-threonylcarbamoyladenosine(37)-C(2))-methylthiotransferase MtaB [Planctomycetes bacterium GWF2_50_10]|nr:MAG: tRNA (N(6)-L-threonylcarbamoyladenosine(37)-C(2))-methylthiotransferase MtaB [Planctomycetes bacterium GWF2_50_10]
MSLPQTFCYFTLGCKVNQYEAQQLRQFLEELGLHKASPKEKPDVVVINSCCVTHTASAKTRNYISKARKLNPDAKIIVRGCLPESQTGEVHDINNGIYLIGHQPDIARKLIEIIYDYTAQSQAVDAISKPPLVHKIKHKNNLPQTLTPLSSFAGQTRAFLKIQDGCDGFCTYCIVRKLRTSLYSKPPSDVLDEACRLVNAGHKEIVLTGIFLGAYGHDTVRRNKWDPNTPSPLAQIVDQIARISGLARLRLSSLEPADLTPELLDVFTRHPAVLAPHLHLPLQSGSDAILKKMCRQYDISQFLSVIDTLKSTLDRPAITTDIIVGFPGETQDDFQQTIDIAKKVEFAKMHIFPFSPRQGTPAADFEPKVPQHILTRRATELASLDSELSLKFKQQFINETASVIVEAGAKGRTQRYFALKLPPSLKKGSLVSVTVTPQTLLKADPTE